MDDELATCEASPDLRHLLPQEFENAPVIGRVIPRPRLAVHPGLPLLFDDRSLDFIEHSLLAIVLRAAAQTVKKDDVPNLT